MRALARNTSIKVLAILLAALCAAVGTLGFFLVYELGGDGAYYLSEEEYLRGRFSQEMYNDINEVETYYAYVLSEAPWTSDFVSAYGSFFSPYETNFFFRVMDYDTGEVLLSNYTAEALVHMGAERYIYPVESEDAYFDWNDTATFTAVNPVVEAPSESASAVTTDPEEWEAYNGDVTASQALPEPDYNEHNPRHVIISAYVRKDLDGVVDNYTDLYHISRLYYSMRGGLLAMTALCGLAYLLLLVFLGIGAGLRRTDDEAHLRRVDRIPWDLYLIGCAGLGLLCYYLLDGRLAIYYGIRWAFQVVTLLVFGAVVGLLFVAAVMSMTARAKVPGSLRNCVLLRLGRGLREPLQKVRDLVRNLPLIRKSVLLIVAVLILEAICVRIIWVFGGMYSINLSLLPLIVLNLALIVIALRFALSLRRLHTATHAIAEVDLTYQVDTRHLSGEFLRQAEDLGRIGEGLSIAVEERTKSEHLKTELITNVSHDLKTPLTSIINYADLLSRVKGMPPEAEEYVDVLRRQAARLKKLTEDLVEASKASTGNLPVELTRLDLSELLLQVTGEYEERFAQAQLTPVLQLPEEPVFARGDGRYLWRILDNLLSNVRKYALPGTRVYIFLSQEQGQAVISVKNISREQLNVQVDELMERFTRGDSSRNTEGSGLGLSIALSLAQLMGGSLTLSADGDLFKAEIFLQKAD